MDNAGLPIPLEDWTWETVVNVVKRHEFEPGHYDYKDVLHPTGQREPEHNDSIRRTACSMANTDGGFILFGVLDRKKSVSTPEARIKGIPIQGDLRKEFGDKISVLQPELFFNAILIRDPDDVAKGVFVVYIPKSQRRPHMMLPYCVYYRRGEGGQAFSMNHYEVREQMINTEERLQRVTLFRLKIAQYLSLITMMLSEGSNVVRMLYRFDTSGYDPLLADICSLLPSSENLLSLLLQIPLQANMINNYLDQTSNSSMPPPMNVDPSFYIGDVNGIRTNLDGLQKYCMMCQKRLDKLFGPLVANGPVTLNDMLDLER